MNINEQLSQGQKKYGASGKDYFSFKEGENRIRVLTEGIVIATHFFENGSKPSTCYGVDEGCPFHGTGAPKDDKGKEKKSSIKYTCYVLNVKDPEQKVQLADLPYSVIKQIGDYQQNIDYTFDSFPMPYDITVKYDKNASPNDMYKVIASPKREEVSKLVLEKLSEQMDIETPQDHVEKKKKWQMEDHDKRGIRKQVVHQTNEEMNKEMADKIASGEMPNPDADKVPYPQDDIKPEDIPW
jgi:hypothetical protein